MLPPEIEALLGKGPIVFDADGTLWAGDVGDELVRDLGCFDEYDRRVREDPIAAYAWAVEILFGMDEHALEERTDVEGTIERGQAQPLSRKRLVRTLCWLIISGVSLYLVVPAVLDTLSSWQALRDVSLGWLGAVALLQAVTLACLWLLQAIAMHTLNDRLE